MGVLGLAPFLQKTWYVPALDPSGFVRRLFLSPEVFKSLPRRLKELTGKTIVMYVLRT